MEVIVAVGVAGRSDELLNVLRQWAFGMLDRIFFSVLLNVLPLHGVGKCGDGIARFGFTRGAGYGDGVLANLHENFRAGEEEAFALGSAVDEVDTKAEIEALWIVKEREQNVIHIATVVPEAQAAGGHGARGTFGARDEVGAAEKMHEKIAGNTGSIVLPLAPLEEAFAGERNLRRRSEKARPIASFGGGVKWNGVVPGADGGVA